MIDKPFYSALGRIRKLLIFSTDLLSVDQLKIDSSHTLLFIAKIQNDIPDLFRLLRDTGMELNICYDYADDVVIPEGLSHPQIKFIFAKDSKCSLPGKWTQDTMHFVPDGQQVKVLLQSHNQAVVIEDCIADALRKNDVFNNFERILQRIDGGNVLRGRDASGEDYLITGPRHHCTATTEELALYFDVKQKRIFRLEFDDDLAKEVFYHLDMFLMIVGIVPGAVFSGRELILMAKVKCGDPEKENRLNESIDKAWKQLQEQSGNMFERLDLPFILIANNGEKTYSYSACNGIVENYYDEERNHVLNIYFPRFLEHAYEDYTWAQKAEQEKFLGNAARLGRDILNEIAHVNPLSALVLKQLDVGDFSQGVSDSIFSSSNILNSKAGLLMHKEKIVQSSLELIGQWFKERIQETVSRIHARDTHINLNFQDITRKGNGSLHCRVKVIERDRVNINLKQG